MLYLGGFIQSKTKFKHQYEVNLQFLEYVIENMWSWEQLIKKLDGRRDDSIYKDGVIEHR